jgi:hypothetical protein
LHYFVANYRSIFLCTIVGYDNWLHANRNASIFCRRNALKISMFKMLQVDELQAECNKKNEIIEAVQRHLKESHQRMEKLENDYGRCINLKGPKLL